MESDTGFSLISSKVSQIIKESSEIIDENNTKAVNPRSMIAWSMRKPPQEDSTTLMN